MKDEWNWETRLKCSWKTIQARKTYSCLLLTNKWGCSLVYKSKSNATSTHFLSQIIAYCILVKMWFKLTPLILLALHVQILAHGSTLRCTKLSTLIITPNRNLINLFSSLDIWTILIIYCGTDVETCHWMLHMEL